MLPYKQIWAGSKEKEQSKDEYMRSTYNTRLLYNRHACLCICTGQFGQHGKMNEKNLAPSPPFYAAQRVTLRLSSRVFYVYTLLPSSKAR